MLSKREIKLVKIRMIILDIKNLKELCEYLDYKLIMQVSFCLNQKPCSRVLERKLKDFIKPLEYIDIVGL